MSAPKETPDEAYMHALRLLAHAAQLEREAAACRAKAREKLKESRG